MNRPRSKQTGLPENVREKNGAWHIRFFEIIDGKRASKEKKLCRVASGKEALYRALAEFHGQSRAVKAPNMPELIDAYRRQYFPTLTPQTQKEYGWQYEKISIAFADFDVEILQKRDCIEFLEMHTKPRSRMRQVYRDRLVSFFRWAADQAARQPRA